MDLVKSVPKLTHASTTNVTPMPTVCQTQRYSMRTATNANVKMDSMVTEMSAMFTSHYALVTCAVTMKSDKLTLTNTKLESANANVVSVMVLTSVAPQIHVHTLLMTEQTEGGRYL